MKFAAALLLALSLAGARAATPYQPVEGDMIFQSMTHSDLTDAIEALTESPLSHCGLVHQIAGSWFVLEAVGPVTETPLDEWIARGREGKYRVFRLKEPYRDKIPAMVVAAEAYTGRPYDFSFDFDNREMYCSELLFKAFQKAAKEDLGKVQTLGELKYQGHEDYIRSLEGGIVPLERKMITPRAISEAPQLSQVYPVQ